MNSFLGCIPCYFDQALRAARFATSDETEIKTLLDELGGRLKEIPLERKPPEVVAWIYGRIAEMTGTADPYAKLKAQSTAQALELHPYLERRVQGANDPLLMAIRVAIAGNIIDFGAASSFDLRGTVEDTLIKDFAVLDYPALRERLPRTNTVLIIGDNAGETVFDRPLISQLNKEVTYAARGGPVTNDATLEDARQAGLDQVSKLITTGAAMPGAVLERCSPPFREAFWQADLVLSKGQGNYEALIGVGREVFFLLRVKCKVLADHIGVEQGAIVLQASGG
jgi:uncharacterized protein with ATP-grasp and redox domains